MKIEMGVDIYPWTTNSRERAPLPYAWCQMPTKLDYATRYKFTVEIPDPRKPDTDLGQVSALQEAA